MNLAAIIEVDQLDYVVVAAGAEVIASLTRQIEILSSRLANESAAQYGYLPGPSILLHFYGQSLSMGLGSIGTISGATPFTNVFMPDYGVHDGAWTAGGSGLTGLESLSTSLVTLNGATNSRDIEAPVIGAANQLASRMAYADIIAADAGRGGFAIDGLKEGYAGGAGPYALLVDQFATYETLNGGKPLKSVLCWLQGESDANIAPITTPANNRINYKTDLADIISDYGTDTGQASLHVVSYQLASHTMRAPGYNYNIALALGEMGEERDDFSLATPMYFFDYVAGDGVHPTSEGFRLCGAYFGKAIDHYFRTGLKFEPLKPLMITRSGAVITVKFKVPIGNLVVDTSVVSDPGNYGFEVFDSVGGGLLTISNVYVYGDTAVITLASTPSNPVEVGYALGSTLNGQPAGPLTGARGCLRDEDETRAYFNSAIRLRNYCVMFRKPEGYGV